MTKRRFFWYLLAIMNLACRRDAGVVTRPPDPPPLDPPATVTLVSGDNQTWTTNQMLPLPFTVRVTTVRGNGFVFFPVTWSVVGGDGRLCAYSIEFECSEGAFTMPTDYAGTSRIAFLPTIADSVIVTATAPGLQGSPISFIARRSRR
jgi:hypothetical protein